MLLEQMAQLNKKAAGSKKSAAQQREQQPAVEAAQSAGDAGPALECPTPEAVQKRLKQLQKKLRQVERIQVGLWGAAAGCCASD
jgi:hypothetical protein